MQIPGKNGYLGILPGHAPLITELAVGQISYRNGSETHYLCVAWGFAEVLPGQGNDSGGNGRARAKTWIASGRRKRKNARRSGSTSNDPEVDVPRAQNALARASTRLEVAEKEGSTAPSQ